MTDTSEDGQTTITIRKSTLKRFNDAKKDTKTSDVPELSADQFLNSLLDTAEKVEEQGYGEGETETERVLDAIENQLHFAQATGAVRLPEEVCEQLDRIESAVSTAEERTGRVERLVEEFGGERR